MNLANNLTRHCRFKQPLFVQALMGLKNLYDAKPVAIYVLGKPAEGDLKRPFKVGGFLGGTFHPLHTCAPLTVLPTAAANPQTDKAAIDEAEKRAAKKDE